MMNWRVISRCRNLGVWGGALLAFASLSPPGRAGYEQPCYIDGCQSADGRYVVTAAAIERGKTVHGPHRWEFTWKDTKTGETATFPAQGVPGGQVYGQLFIAPDGQTFALWNHVTLWTSGKSEMHGPKDLVYHEDSDAWRSRPEFSRRLIVYRKDGSIVKELGVADLLRREEWESVLRVFNRVEWLRPYDNLNFKATPRMQYAWYRVSPDYTVLEFRVVEPRAVKDKSGRRVRVSLADGRVLDPALELSEPAKIPVRPFRDDGRLPHSSPEWKESYVPSLDPVRQPGTYRLLAADAAWPKETAPKPQPFPYGEARLIRAGYQQADTPTWLPGAAGNKTAGIVFTDLKAQQLYLFTPPNSVSEGRADLTRGRVGPDKRFYGIQLLRGQAADHADPPAARPVLVSWQPGEEPQTILEQAADGRELSLNDLAVASRGMIYFTTLKDPDKGRLSLVDPASKQVRVLFDGEQEPRLCNPNGVALSPDERFLFVGISHYKNRRQSGVYCFPLRADGTLELELGKAGPWAAVPGPDGIAVDRGGNVFFTAGNVVEAYDRYGRRWGSIKIPKGSGSNLCFGGEAGETLYVTTSDALYVVEKK